MSLQPQNLFDLKGRIALVTGGATGIGLQIAHGLASAGATVYISGRRYPLLCEIADKWNGSKPEDAGKLMPLGPLDVTDKDSIKGARDIIERDQGKLHILVNNAGQSGPTSPFLGDASAPERKNAETLGNGLFNNESFEQWTDLYKINTFSIFFVTTAFLGLLEKGSLDDPGRTSVVINITSISSVIKLAQEHFAYNSSKAAASHMTKMLATELAVKGVNVRVNAVAPGVWPSEMTLEHIGADTVDKIGKGLQPVPAKRAGHPGEMAGTVVYLASRAGEYTNGQELVVDGGYIAVNPAVC